MIRWDDIDTVLLDMDGTLLDLHFDNYFWLHLLPEKIAAIRDVSIEEAKSQLVADYGRHKGTLNWYCLDFWAESLGIDIMGLKNTLRHKVAVRPHALDFMAAIQESGRRAILCTNSHRAGVELKLEETGIGKHLDAIVSSHDYGMPKEDVRFWDVLHQQLGFQHAATLLVDDNEDVLASAQRGRIGHLAGILHPDSQRPRISFRDFNAIDSFLDVMPTPRIVATDGMPQISPATTGTGSRKT